MNESSTSHWTGADHSLVGMINVDGNTYRFLGKETPSFKTIVPASDEKAYQVSYTETEPMGDWKAADYDANKWKILPAPQRLIPIAMAELCVLDRDWET